VVSLTFVFWMMVVLFGVIGAMRGWAKELLVSFSVILALTFTTLLQNYIPYIRDILPKDGTTIFWIRTSLLLTLVVFGYQTPNIPKFAGKFTRERLQDALLGIFLGAINGYLIVGTLWFFLYEAKYPFPAITDPALSGVQQYADAAKLILTYLPPHLLGVPAIYFAVVLAFAFVIVVFI
jgi:uncharacterized membrane protein required for colicin V production